MLLIVLAACTSAPVPPHGDVAPALLEAGLKLDWDETTARAAALAAPVEGLSGVDDRKWGAVREAAETMAVARKKSHFSEAYGQLLAACEACHRGQVLHEVLPEGHGGGYLALELSVLTNDRALADEGLRQLQLAPDLGPSQPRFLDLAGKIRDAKSTPSAGKFLGRAVLECYQCHGSMVQ
ncbi:MAG: hypothetical protein H6737_12660 [Alphaproteobacteria bacterium]|nr:hypothetical protein [Alphaproteobacteria bacterium]